MKLKPMKNRGAPIGRVLSVLAKPRTTQAALAPTVGFLQKLGVKNPRKLLGAGK